MQNLFTRHKEAADSWSSYNGLDYLRITCYGLPYYLVDHSPLEVKPHLDMPKPRFFNIPLEVLIERYAGAVMLMQPANV